MNFLSIEVDVTSEKRSKIYNSLSKIHAKEFIFSPPETDFARAKGFLFALIKNL